MGFEYFVRNKTPPGSKYGYYDVIIGFSEDQTRVLTKLITISNSGGYLILESFKKGIKPLAQVRDFEKDPKIEELARDFAIKDFLERTACKI